jgi:hypothetical protein
MGQMTQIQIAEWQKKAGIEPVTGERAKILRQMSAECYELIKIIELELSGIRDGDGYWHGDAMGAADVLAKLIERFGEPLGPEETVTAAREPSDLAEALKEYDKIGIWHRKDGERLTRELVQLLDKRWPDVLGGARASEIARAIEERWPEASRGWVINVALVAATAASEAE